jgi:hypothetical protein
MSDTPKTDWSETLETIAQRAEHRANQLESELATALADTQRLRASERRLKAMIPLFEEARDALTAIPLASAKLRGVRLDLADRMDDVGVPSRWEVIDAAMREEKP